MKKQLLLTLFILGSLAARAQNFPIQLSVLNAPCNGNGTVVASMDTAFSWGWSQPIFPVTWYYTLGAQFNTNSITHTSYNVTDTLNGLSANFIHVYAYDANGNYIYEDSTVLSGIQVTANNGLANCPTPGTMTAVVATGATPPFSYSWTDASGAVVGNGAGLATTGGYYQVAVTDATGCSGVALAEIFDQNAIQANVSTTQAGCTNGTAIITSLTGGQGPFTYQWSNGAITPAITNLTTGVYSVMLTDANGCHGTAAGYVQQSVAVSVGVTPVQPTCQQSNGSLTAYAAGGTAPYTFTYNNSFNGATLNGLSAGIYSVAVTDANGCIGGWHGVLSPSTSITVTNTITPSSCTSATGSATLAIAGGQAPYTVSWTNVPGQSGATVSNLPVGYYHFMITDAGGCMQQGTVYIPPVSAITAQLTTTQPTCTQANGSIDAGAVAGGTAPYTYAWTGTLGAPIGTGSAVTNVSAGYYSVIITDAVGCQKSFAAVLNAISALTLGVTPTDASCMFNSDGAITAVATNGTPPYSYSWGQAGMGTGTSVTGLRPGSYYAHVSDAAGCTTTTYATVGYNAANTGCYCTITGTAYNDANANCVQDAGELGLGNIGINLAGVNTVFTDAAGHYTIYAPTGIYTLLENVPAGYPLSPCQNNNNTVMVTAGSGCTQTFDFGNTITPLHDVAITGWNMNFPVPGNVYNQAVLVTNHGTVDESDVTATYTTDGQLGAATFTPGGIYSGSGNQYSAGSMVIPAGGSQLVYAAYNTPTNIALGTGVVFDDTAAYAAPLGNWLNDNTPWNNVHHYTVSSLSSYDPNFMEVAPQGSGAAGYIDQRDSILTYMVHFQNTGNYYAENIVVKCPLDSDLDWNTLRPTYSSAPMSTQIDAGGIATFTFSYMNLAPKADNEAGSNGMFTFTIHPKAGLPLGTEFRNKAFVYFDYNAPVATDTTLNTLGSPTAISNTAMAKAVLNLYPNPTTGILNIDYQTTGNTLARLVVTDLYGRSIAQKMLDATTPHSSLNLGNNASGIYYYQLLVNGKAVQTGKISLAKQ